MSSVDYSTLGGDLVHPVVTGGDIVRAHELGGREFADVLVGYGKAWLTHASGVRGMVSAGVRSASSASSHSSGSRSGGSGLLGARLGAIRRVASWRRSDDSGCSVVSPGGSETGLVGRPKHLPSGLCYSKVFLSGAVQDRVLRCGEWPTFSSLVRQPAKLFQSLSSLERFRLVDQGEGRFHMAAGGDKGVSFLGAVKSYSQGLSLRPGSLAAVVRDSPSVLSSGPAVQGSSRVGGDVSVPTLGQCAAALAAATAFASAGVSVSGLPEYEALVARVASLREASGGRYDALGPSWVFSSEVLATVRDVVVPQRHVVRFEGFEDSAAVAAAEYSVLERVYEGYCGSLSGSTVTFVAPTGAFVPVSPGSVELGLSVVSKYDSLVKLGLKSTYQWLSPLGAEVSGPSVGAEEGLVLARVAESLGVRRLKPSSHPWVFVDALTGGSPVDLTVVEASGRRRCVTVLVDGEGRFQGFVAGGGASVWPLYAEETVVSSVVSGAVLYLA